MKIAFVGKGGSGKSTLTALYTSLVSVSKPVLVIDADINMHIGTALGFDEQRLSMLPALGAHGKAIKEYLRGTNERIVEAKRLIKTTPPGRGSNFVRVSKEDTFLQTYTLQKKNIFLMAAGKLQDEDKGAYCYHKYSGIAEIILNHLLDKEEDRVVVDMTAGTDAFSTGLFAAFDVTFMIVEPTRRSMDVFQQYSELAKEFNITLYAIGNKVRDNKDLALLQDNLGSALFATVEEDEHVRSYDQGMISSLTYDKLTHSNRQTLQKIEERVATSHKNWAAFYSTLCALHIKNATTWANDMHGIDFTKQIDPDFTYTSLL